MLHATPVRLGSLTLFRSIVQALCYPLAAYMASRYNQVHVIALGDFLRASATFLVAISTTFLQVLLMDSLFLILDIYDNSTKHLSAITFLGICCQFIDKIDV